MSTFSERVKDLRLSSNLSLRQLSKLTNISHSAISAYETGKREPSFESIEALCDVFCCDIDYLLGRSDIKCAVLHGTGYNNLYEAQKNGFDFDLQLFSENKSPSNDKLSEEDLEILELIKQVPEMKELVKMATEIPEEKLKSFLEMGRLYSDSLKKG